ncbi:phage holin [Lactococcus taiwanensis]|uniref:phage holin n=1 Tax=Lactococcus taiwanensis TaxID=1151742 RepID=UPI00351439D7
MILNDKTYHFIKWVVLVVLPALGVLTGVLGKAYGWDGTDLAVITINAIAVFGGSVTGVSSAVYNKQQTMGDK